MTRNLIGFKCFNCGEKHGPEAKELEFYMPCGCSYSWLKPAMKTQKKEFDHNGKKIYIDVHFYASGRGIEVDHPSEEAAIKLWREKAIKKLSEENSIYSKEENVFSRETKALYNKYRGHVCPLDPDWCYIEPIQKLYVPHNTGQFFVYIHQSRPLIAHTSNFLKDLTSLPSKSCVYITHIEWYLDQIDRGLLGGFHHDPGKPIGQGYTFHQAMEYFFDRKPEFKNVYA